MRVGADKTFVPKFLSTIFENLSFIFVPIPSDPHLEILEERITYSEFKWNNQDILSFIPPELSTRGIHNDPEYISCTYGSPKYNKDEHGEKNYSTLINLKQDDLLVFFAAFRKDGTLRKGGKIDYETIFGYYIFAYFIIDQIVAYTSIESLREEQIRFISNSYHYIHKWKDQVIVVGNPEKSRLFEKAVLLSSRQNDLKGTNYYPCEEIEEILDGYNVALNMSSIRTFDLPSITQKFKRYLDDNSGRNLLEII